MGGATSTTRQVEVHHTGQIPLVGQVQQETVPDHRCCNVPNGEAVVVKIPQQPSFQSKRRVSGYRRNSINYNVRITYNQCSLLLVMSCVHVL